MFSKKLGIIALVTAALMALTACDFTFPNPEADFRADLERLGYTVVGTDYEAETTSPRAVTEARTVISDETDPDCYVEFERDADESKETTVNGHSMLVFELDEVEDENGEELKDKDMAIPPDSPDPDETLAFLQGLGDKLSFCLAA